MAAWFWYAVVAAVLYGAHQIFTRIAADHIGEGLGGFVVEATAALSILLYLAFLWLASRWNQQSSNQGIFYSVLTGICVGAGTIAFFSLVPKGGSAFRRTRHLGWRRGDHGYCRHLIFSRIAVVAAAARRRVCNRRFVPASTLVW